MRRLFLGILLSLALLVNVFAQDELQKVRINLFDGGQNSFDLPSIISPNQGVLYENTVLNKKGQLFKRKGQRLFASDVSNTAFTGVGTFYPDPNTSYILAASDVSIIRGDTEELYWTTINSASPLTAGKNTEFLQANDLCFILNGYNTTVNYNGSIWDPGSTSTASPPVGTTAAWLRNYFFVAGNPTHSDWIYFSNNLEPKLFTPTDVIKVNTGDGQKIIRLEPFKLNELVIYKQKSIFILDITGSTPLTDWTVQPITKSIGCAALRSVVNLGNDHWFLSSEPFAVRSLTRTSYDKLLVDMVSQPIQDIFDGTGTTTINKNQIDKACAVLFDNKFILAIPTGTSTYNNLVVIYDFFTKSWYEITGWYPAGWVVFNNNLYYIDATDGRVLQCFYGISGDVASGPIVTSASEPTVAIKFEYISKDIDFDNPENFKALDALEVEFEAVGSYNAEVYINIDNRGWQDIGSISLAGVTPTLPVDLPIVLVSENLARKTFQLQKYGEFKKIRVRVVQNGLGQECNLHSFTLFAKIRPWRRE